MKNWTIGRRIVSGFGLLVGIILLVGGAVVYQVSRIHEDLRDVVENELPGVDLLTEMRGKVVAAHRVVFRCSISLTSDDVPAQRERFEGTVREIEDFRSRYGGYVDKGSDAESRAQATVAAWGRYVEAARAALDFDARSRFDEAQASLRTGGPVSASFDGLYAALAEEIQAKKAVAKRRSAGSVGIASQVVLFTLVGVGSSVLAAVAVSVFISRGVTASLRQIGDVLETSSECLTGVAGEVAGNSQSLADGASRQAASLEETSASLEEISSMTSRNADGATQAKDVSTRTRTAAEAGLAQTHRMREAMDAVEASGHEMETALDGIRRSGDEVAKIIKTIDEIAFQTNILALNAAVEAARAGEAGAGFAVVAEEVRALAQRSADAAKETTRIIEDSLTQGRKGVEVNRRVQEGVASAATASQSLGGSLGQIVELVREVDGLVSSINTASGEQKQGLSQISTAMSHIDSVTQSTASGAEEAAAAAEELSTQTHELRNAIGSLLLLIGWKEKDRRKVDVPVDSDAEHRRFPPLRSTVPASPANPVSLAVAARRTGAFRGEHVEA